VAMKWLSHHEPSQCNKIMERKLQIYARCGVEEYYIYDPDRSIDSQGLST
jgi:Uma2 family endonuclease